MRGSVGYTSPMIGEGVDSELALLEPQYPQSSVSPKAAQIQSHLHDETILDQRFPNNWFKYDHELWSLNRMGYTLGSAKIKFIVTRHVNANFVLQFNWFDFLTKNL